MLVVSGEAKLMLPELYTKGCDGGPVTFWGRHSGVQLQQAHHDNFSSQRSQWDWLEIPRRSVGKEEKEEKSQR